MGSCSAWQRSSPVLPPIVESRALPPPPTPACRYRKDFIPELDGLRAIAALLVLFLGATQVHLPAYSLGPELFELHRWIAPGAAGVDLFFVLSGFLITRILLVDRELGVPLRQFLIRRCLRIFPIYYLKILIVWHQLSGFELAALLTYTANFALLFTWGHCPMDHAWSLAVEEHFYLLWPPIAVFLTSGLHYPVRRALKSSGARGCTARSTRVDSIQSRAGPAPGRRRPVAAASAFDLCTSASAKRPGNATSTTPSNKPMLHPNPRASAGSAEATASLQLSHQNAATNRSAHIGGRAPTAPD